MERDIQWIFDDLDKTEELVLCINPIAPISISCKKGKTIVFNKTPSKDMLCGLLQHLIGLRVTDNNAFKKYFKRKKIDLKIRNVDSVRNEFFFLPVLDHLFDVDGIKYPNNIHRFYNYSNVLSHRKDNDANLFNGYLFQRFNDPTFREELRTNLPFYYSSQLQREYGICDSPYYIKIKCTKSLKEEIESNINFCDTLYLGTSDSICNVEISNDTNITFESYIDDSSKELNSIKDILDVYDSLSISEQFGLSIIISEIFSINHKNIDLLFSDDVLNTQLSSLREKTVKVIEKLMTTAYLKRIKFNEDNTIVYSYSDTIDDGAGRGFKGGTGGAGYVIHTNLLNILNSPKESENLRLQILNEELLKCKQFMNPFATKSTNSYNRDYYLKHWFLIAASVCATLTKDKLYYYNNIIEEREMFVPNLGLKNMILFNSLICKNLALDKQNFFIADTSKIRDKKPTIQVRNINSTFTVSEECKNNMLQEYLFVLNINIEIGEIIRKLSLHDDAKDLLKELSKTTWSMVNVSNRYSIKVSELIQDILLNDEDNTSTLGSFLKVLRTAKFEKVESIFTLFLNLIINPNIKTYTCLVKAINKYNSRSAFKKEKLYIDIDNQILNKIMEKETLLSIEEKNNLILLGKELNRQAFFLANEKIKKEKPANPKEALRNAKWSYLNSMGGLVTVSSSYVDFVSKLTMFFKRYQKENPVWSYLTPYLTSEMSFDKLKEIKNYIYISIFATNFDGKKKDEDDSDVVQEESDLD